MQVSFFKDDATLEQFPGESDSLVIEFPFTVQITYNLLRTSGTGIIDSVQFIEGDTVAVMVDLWIDEITGQHWSDIVIGSED